ncbi:MAG: hypothetical protein Q8K63_04365 [Acidimicrobiales bacterium]|nr:hypothetical protein [Acidimicrobiales bacterium]
MSTAFQSTHTVPDSGLPTWPAPDGTATPGPSLEGKSRVQLLEHQYDGWARVRCDNGWECWVDGRELIVEAKTGDRVSPLVLAGVAAVVVSAFLPWVNVAGGEMTAWEMPLKFLLGQENDLGGPTLGVALLIFAAAALVPLVARVALPWFAVVSVAALVTEAAALTLLRVRALDIEPTVGIGAVFAVVGAAFIALSAGLQATRQ